MELDITLTTGLIWSPTFPMPTLWRMESTSILGVQLTLWEEEQVLEQQSTTGFIKFY